MRLYQLSNVSFGYGDTHLALRELRLEFGSGEFVLLLGANGSGKTTLLKILDGLLFPRSGTVQFESEPLTERRLTDRAFNRYFRQRVAMLFQNAEVQLFCPTVADDIMFGPRQLGLEPGHVQQRLQDSLRLLDIERLATSAALNLSEGEKQRVALASVLALNPEVLLLDEPFARLDPRTTRKVSDLLAGLKAAGKTIILATHDLARASSLADKAVVLAEDGSLLATGLPATVLDDNDLLSRANLI